MRARRMTSRLTAEVAREIDTRCGARVRAVHQDGPARIRLALRAPQRSAQDVGHEDLVIDLEPAFPRVLLDRARRAPRAPTALAGALRKHLVGARVAQAWSVDGERALAIGFTRGDQPRTLWVEMFGGQANWYLLDEAGAVLWTLRGEVAARREASRDQVFVPVPPRPLDQHEGDADEDSPGEADSPVGSAAVLALWRAARSAHQGGSATARLRRFLKRRRTRATKEHTALTRALEGAERAPQLEREGELLRGAFHLLKPGQTKVVVPDYDRDPPKDTIIELHADLPPGEQIAERFRRARRLRRTAETAQARYGEVATRLAAIESVLALLVNDAEDAAVLRKIIAALPAALRAEAERALERPKPQTAKKGPTRALPWFEFESADGWPILVGRDARGNDALTLRKARPGDLFLHVRSATGSHVIVPTPRSKTVPRDTLLDAAELACHFSERRAAARGEVDYTPRRYVRKPKGSPPGLVFLERSKTLSLRRDDARRTRLLSSKRTNRP